MRTTVLIIRGKKLKERILNRRYSPSSDPGRKGSPFLAGELGAPVVEPAGGRVGRADLRHGQRDAAVERRDDEPAQRHGRRAAVAQAGVVRRGDARQHGDDGEGEGEVGEEATTCSCRGKRFYMSGVVVLLN